MVYYQCDSGLRSTQVVAPGDADFVHVLVTHWLPNLGTGGRPRWGEGPTGWPPPGAYPGFPQGGGDKPSFEIFLVIYFPPPHAQKLPPPAFLFNQKSNMIRQIYAVFTQKNYSKLFFQYESTRWYTSINIRPPKKGALILLKINLNYWLAIGLNFQTNE